MKIASVPTTKVADEAWIAAALLQKEHPEQVDFSIEEIMARAREENVTGQLRPGVYVHVIQHCVANRPANPGRYRMLLETAPGRRRLFRVGDPYHPSREGGKVTPDAGAIPNRYVDVISWYREWSSRAAASRAETDPLLALKAAGLNLWTGERPDDYVRRLREGWE
jgi:hypothetical protein